MFANLADVRFFLFVPTLEYEINGNECVKIHNKSKGATLEDHSI
ncbi:hypothetical protein SAMN03080599_03239 [Acidaminobacter hydrogenoformans DSM 2784]|uniref:Uncharacterized protein n=1 Tax=Acidaminobacter hydrogenoformans DSM 2784 TaxID=1120920 RepID=A0A1G5S6N5_9FIRM|nr:hypothetical protein SAMN03080599_03239 [Acidaminobacter hydrogenoformans DSM 2784]